MFRDSASIFSFSMNVLWALSIFGVRFFLVWLLFWPLYFSPFSEFVLRFVFFSPVFLPHHSRDARRWAQTWRRKAPTTSSSTSSNPRISGWSWWTTVRGSTPPRGVWRCLSLRPFLTSSSCLPCDPPTTFSFLGCCSCRMWFSWSWTSCPSSSRWSSFVPGMDIAIAFHEMWKHFQFWKLYKIGNLSLDLTTKWGSTHDTSNNFSFFVFTFDYF